MSPETWTILELVNWACDYFKTHHIENPRSAAEILLGYSLGLARVDLYVQYDRPLEAKELAVFKALIQRRLKREPVAYLVGEKGFWSLDLKVTSDVLIPRPETEFLVEAALSIMPKNRSGVPWNVLDLGTGSGAIVLALATELPFHRYFGTDVSAAALRIARENARRFMLTETVHFFCGSWFDPVKVQGVGFDVIVSNPPYIRRDEIGSLAPEVSVYEPPLALDGGIDGLDFVRIIVEQAVCFLKPKGWLFLEIGHDQWPAVEQIVLNTTGYLKASAVKDYAGVNRIVQAQWLGG